MPSCLIVVDMQNDFVSGSLGTAEAQAVAARVAQKITERRANGFDVIFTMDTHGSDYLATSEGKTLPVVHCVQGTDGHALCNAVQQVLDAHDRVIEKPSFGSEELFDLLRAQPYDTIELVGLVTDICVLANAVLAKTACPESDVCVDASCTAGTTPELRAEALDVMRSLQIRVEE